MIEGLKPYAEYKESGLPWLDTVPKHWDMAPNRALMQEQQRVVGENASDHTLLSLTLRGVIARDMENPKGKFPAQFNTYKVVRPDDFVFCLFDIDETPRGVGLSNQKGMITGAYDVFSPRRRINPRFLYHYYLFVDEGKLMKPLYTGLRKTIQHGVFASLKAPCPPPDEQAAIVRFLDHANRKIDGFIRAKRKLIGLLHEQKQAIIHRAVTRGLNPDVPLKPSGIPWLGDIPAHWEVMQMRHVLSFGPKNGVSPQASNGGGVLSFSISAVRDGRISIPGNEKVVELDHARVAGFRIHKGDILLVRGNGNVALVGKCGLVDECPKSCVYPDILMKLRPNDKLTAEFLVLAVNSAYVSNQVSTLAKTSNGAFKVSGASVQSIVIAVPPRSQQGSIQEQLSNVLANAECARERMLSEIALMQEYRTRLTADIVTGKLDVREAAAKLPDLPADATAEPAADEPRDDLDSEESHE